MKFDMHTHSESSHDSQCSVSDMARTQSEKGISGFAVTDHWDMGYLETVDIDKIAEDSHKSVDAAHGKYGVKIFKGAEIGEEIWYPEEVKRITSNHTFDVIIGSVHAVRYNGLLRYEGLDMPYSQLDFGSMSDELLTEYIKKYFDDVLCMVMTTDIDIAAHITCPMRYINGKYGRGFDCTLFKDKIHKILDCIIHRKIALEVNTSQMRENSEYYSPMPEEWIIAEYKKRGGKLITVGSDAHAAENAALSFDEAYAMLKKIGFENCCYYENRQPNLYKI